jgi:hypothetical protein
MIFLLYETFVRKERIEPSSGILDPMGKFTVHGIHKALLRLALFWLLGRGCRCRRCLRLSLWSRGAWGQSLSLLRRGRYCRRPPSYFGRDRSRGNLRSRLGRACFLSKGNADEAMRGECVFIRKKKSWQQVQGRTEDCHDYNNCACSDDLEQLQFRSSCAYQGRAASFLLDEKEGDSLLRIGKWLLNVKQYSLKKSAQGNRKG